MESLILRSLEAVMRVRSRSNEGVRSRFRGVAGGLVVLELPSPRCPVHLIEVRLCTQRRRRGQDNQGQAAQWQAPGAEGDSTPEWN